MSIRSRYNRVYRSLSRVELQTGLAEFEAPDLFGTVRDERWLGYYTEEGLDIALNRYGLYARLAEVGYETCRLVIETDQPDEHLLRIYSEAPRIPNAPLIELVSRPDVVATGELCNRLGISHLPVLNIEWLQLQRPDALFTRKRPPLPGQRYPGLGIGREIMELLRMATKRLDLEALATVPSYFHNAFFYSVEFSYMDPNEHGTFLALCRDLLPAMHGSVAAVTWAIHEQLVTNAEGEPFEWFHDVMVGPVSDRVTSYLTDHAYRKECKASAGRTSYRVDNLRLKARLRQLGIDPLNRERIEAWIDA